MAQRPAAVPETMMESFPTVVELVETIAAAAVSYLASDDAAAVTGQALRVDGGLVTL